MARKGVNGSARKYLFCNACRRETEHECDGEQSRDYPNYDDGRLVIVERMGYRLWTCLGCKTGSLEEYYIFDVTSEDFEDPRTWTYTYYPPRNEFEIKSKEFKQLNGKLEDIYRQTLSAFNNDLPVLCAIGIRCLLDGICEDKGIKGRALGQRIDKMVAILPQNIVSNLHSIRFIGNEAAHELAAPGKDELRLAIELCEDLLNFLYELDYKARVLTQSRGAKKRVPAQVAQGA